MKTTMLGCLAETAIHSGAGRSAGIIDLPIAREATTDYPFIAGSSFKGALRDRAREIPFPDSEIDALFGRTDRAGQLLVSDLRLLLLPIRSLTGAYRWATCPLVLERYERDLRRCARPAALAVDAVSDSCVYACDVLHNKLYLEEREFTVQGQCSSVALDLIKSLVLHTSTAQRIHNQVVILSNNDFAWFCRSALPIQARNALDEITKRSLNLWYEESLPPDTLLYGLAMTRDAGAERVLSRLFPAIDPYLQIGGNETVGHGWLAVNVLSADNVGALS